MQFMTCSFYFTLQVLREGTEPGQTSWPVASQARPFPPLSAAMTSGAAKNRRAKNKNKIKREAKAEVKINIGVLSFLFCLLLTATCCSENRNPENNADQAQLWYFEQE